MAYGADNLCRNCGYRNRSGSRYCSECGSRIDGVCVSCGHENEPQARFCNSCGVALIREASQVLPQSAADTPVSDASVCPRCLHQNEPESSFCYHCGLPLEGEAARAAPSAIGAFQQGLPGGFWMRVIAVFIDNIVLGVFAFLIWTLFYALLGVDIYNLDSGDDPSGVSTLAVLIIYFLAFLYSPVLISLWGTTIGKRALGLYVVRSNGARCGFWRALGRQLAQILSAILFGIGYLMVAFREDKRALHDLIADTAVIHRY